MSVKLILLKSGETIITDAKEALNEDGKPQVYIFEKPFEVQIQNSILLAEEEQKDSGTNKVNVILSPWIIFTADEKIAVNPDWVVTVVDPVKDLLEMYEEKVK